MRLPNGYDCVFKLYGNRRRPYCARKTISNVNGKQKYYTVGYYETRAEALEALAKFNEQQDTPTPTITLAKVYQQWYPIHSRQVSKSTSESYKNSFNHLKEIASKPLDKIKFRHLQDVIDNMIDKKSGKPLSYASKKKVRSLINQLYAYAIINEYIDKSYGQYLELGKNIPRNPHKPFTQNQINKVWNCGLSEQVLVLILLYTGMRIGELLQMKKTEVKLRSKYFDITTSKTRAGIRIVPIHDRIFPLVQEQMKLPGRYLFSDKHGNMLTYAKAATMFDKVMKKINAKHNPHDCRHTVATLLDNAGANKVARDRILGHSSNNVGDLVYTHKSLKQLKKTINLLK
ncbi:tyrosine-type recombinase/integrase [Gallibacterium salpingitidis]|uniref:tyrosine-type recombinase/integrase n=1 Tax=Gallibacterium salpingitidis TaxID=505341 RepID=UPI00266F6660|nr:tyrosine-type recombinase/integrase [Gallibacterium salpingitidis]WKT00547.1 tyrosine-type recombinase/integrase [Gallibacterium salpingitidis]